MTSKEKLHNPHLLSQLTPLYKQELTFFEERSFINVPSALSNIWGVLNGQMDGTLQGHCFQNETECGIVSPTEGIIVIETMSFPRFLPFVMWRKYRDTDIFTKTRRTSDVPGEPGPPSLSSTDSFVDEEDLTDSYVSRTLKFCETGTFTVEIYGVAIGPHPITMKPSRIIELIGQFLVEVQTHRRSCLGHMEIRG
uniref:START domain-containing protein n=1 Tax=Echinococcus granulosus TaxID=6210 RepID=A0A068W8M5_ECHGR|nr:hypothetical protein EgrG_000836400 [Echinococcus granulosus]